jgi:hypothetical protein
MGKGAIPVRKAARAIKRAAMHATSMLIELSKGFPVSAQPPTSNTKASASAPSPITWTQKLTPANASHQQSQRTIPGTNSPKSVSRARPTASAMLRAVYIVRPKVREPFGSSAAADTSANAPRQPPSL